MPSTTAIADNYASELIVLCDKDNIIRFASRSFVQFFRSTMEKCLGQKFAPGGARAAIGKPARYQTNAMAGGQNIIIAWEEKQLENGERLYAGVVHDEKGRQLTNRTLAKDAVAAGEPTASTEGDRKMRLMATMSHEMRTPLNGILGMANLLLDTTLEPNQRTYAEAIRESGGALLALINDVLDYSKFEAGKMELDEAPFSLFTMVQGIAELLSTKAADKGVEIATYVDNNIPLTVYSDEPRLRQVLINLVGNGVKFTDDGGVAIEAHSLGVEDGLARVRIDVRDTGIGIPEDVQSKIFEAFSQADSGAEKKREGTGLGLNIAQKIVNTMGGKLAVESTLGEGSVFSFEITLKCGDTPAFKDYGDVGSVVIATPSTILAQSISAQLTSVGVSDITHVDRAETIKSALSQRPNATLLCDLPFAGDNDILDGQSLSRSFVLVSPLSRGRLDDFHNAGFDGYLIKPIRQSTLYEQLSRPQEENKQQNTQQTTPEPASDDASSKSLRVLLAEDNQINAVLATAVIKRSGHTVELARNGEEAVQAISKAAYDVVLMDMHMPEVDGLEAAQRIRALGGETARTPIIALTANAMASDRQKCVAAGMDDFLSKPFEPDDLAAMLKALGRHKERVHARVLIET